MLPDLDILRQQIDHLDEQIQALISARAALAMQVGKVKQATGRDVEYYRPEREADVLKRVMQRNHGPLANEVLTRLFREIMSACRALEHSLKIAFLGPEGTFSQAAVVKHFGHLVEPVPATAIDQVFQMVDSGGAEFGVVPVENSTEGVVSHTLDMFTNSSLKICGEVELRIHHHLLSLAPGLPAITHVYSHQQSLAQCRVWLATHLPNALCTAVSSNAEAARRAVAEPGSAAIAPAAAAELYQLGIVASNIEDHADNTTRFLVISRKSVPASGNDKTSLLISTRNRPGALHRLLEPFARNGISLMRIESRPAKQGAWNYVFFIDVDGHVQEPALVEALNCLEAETTLVKVLGSYPKVLP